MKKFGISILVFIIGIQIFRNLSVAKVDNLGTYYEAEEAEFITNRENKKDDNASNGEAIFLPSGKVNGTDAYCKFTFNIEQAGFYNLSINSWGVGDEKKNLLDVDGTRLQDLYLNSPREKWEEHTFLKNQYLDVGVHSVTVTAGYGYTYLDYLRVEQVSVMSIEEIYNRKYELSNKNATPKAKELFQYLQNSYGKSILSGQFTYEGINNTDIQRIKEKTGKLPAILGLDLLAVTPSVQELLKYWIPYPNFEKVMDTAVEYASQGGIITFCWHWNLDFSFMKKDANGNYTNAWSAYRPDYVNIDLKKVMADENSKEYKLLERDMDAIAQQLKRLSDQDIPILFRPLHEAGGSWFWWGTGGEDAYIKLWRKMYDKFTNEYHLNNLIWVWNGDKPNWYPGDEYVDICGVDIYNEKKDYNPNSTSFKSHMGYKKIITLSEVGTLPDIDQAFQNKTIWSWFMNWTGVHTIPETNSEEAYTSLEMWSKVYNHEKVITLDESPFHTHKDVNNDHICDFCATQLKTETPTPSINPTNRPEPTPSPKPTPTRTPESTPKPSNSAPPQNGNTNNNPTNTPSSSPNDNNQNANPTGNPPTSPTQKPTPSISNPALDKEQDKNNTEKEDNENPTDKKEIKKKNKNYLLRALVSTVISLAIVLLVKFIYEKWKKEKEI